MVRVFINKVDHKPHYGKVIDGITQASNITSGMELFSHINAQFYPTDNINPFMAAVHAAFCNHVALEISPDVIYNVILQSVSAHVHKHPEICKKMFIKKCDYSCTKIDVANLSNLRQKILDDLYDTKAHYLLNVEFSTTDDAALLAHTCVFLDAVNNYQDYVLVSSCGIPFIDVLGVKQDWIRLSKVIERFLYEVNLVKYNEEIQNIILHFVRAFDGVTDQNHWNGMYMATGPLGSGSTVVTGWISKLFLYIKDGMNPFYEPKKYDRGLWVVPALVEEKHAVALSDFPQGICRLGIGDDKILKAGLIGVVVTDRGLFKPDLGWIICKEDNAKPCAEKRKSWWRYFVDNYIKSKQT